MTDTTPPPGSLQSRFHLLAWSNLLAQSAEQISLAAVPIVAVLSLGAGAAETGALAMAQTLPFLLFSLPMGVMADRVPRRLLMAGAEAIRAATLILLPVLAAFGLLSVPALAALGFLGATGTVAYSVAAPALVPALVPAGALVAANARLELARSGAFAAGPAVAGALVAWAGAGMAFTLAAMLSVAAAILLFRLQEPALPRAARRHIGLDLREGAGFAWSHPLLRPILLTAVVWNTSWFVLQAAYVPYAVDGLGLSPAALGMTLGAYGVGMVAGAALAKRILDAARFGVVIALGPAVSVVAAAVMALSLWRPGPVLPAVSFFLFGAGPILWTICQTTLRQAVTPPGMLGRVSALLMMATFGARPIGAAIGGFVGAQYGLPACVLLALAGFVAQAVVIALSAVPRLRTLPA